LHSNTKDGIQIQVYNINNEISNHFGQFILVTGKKNVRKSQAQFWEKRVHYFLKETSSLASARILLNTSSNPVLNVC